MREANSMTYQCQQNVTKMAPKNHQITQDNCVKV